MVSFLDSFIGLFVQDMGEVYSYITYDVLPDDITVEELEKIAFENLIRDTRYQISQSNDPDIYGILAGGNFEAESLCLQEIWEYASKELEDDLLIAVPTKDMVLFVKAGEKGHKEKLLKMAKRIFKDNEKHTPYLVFCNDLLMYSKKDASLKVVEKY